MCYLGSSRRSVAHLKWTRVGGSVKAATPHEPLKPHSARRRSSSGDKHPNSPEGSVFFKASQSGSSRSTRFRWVSSLSLKRTHPAGVSPLCRSSRKVLASRQIPKLHRRTQRQNRNRVWISARSRVFRRMDQSPHSQMKPALSSNMLSPTLSVLAYPSNIHPPSANRVLARYTYVYCNTSICTYIHTYICMIEARLVELCAHSTHTYLMYGHVRTYMAACLWVSQCTWYCW